MTDNSPGSTVLKLPDIFPINTEPNRGKTMSGPNNYNHDKLTKVITHHAIHSAQWINIIDHNYVSPQKDWMKKLTEKCAVKARTVVINPPCEIKVIRVTIRPVVAFFNASAKSPYLTMQQRSGKKEGWHISMYAWNKIRADVLSNPEYNPDLVYLGGAGGSATMMKYDGKWWFVYGTPRVNNKNKQRNEHEGLLVLHNILLQTWDQSYVDKHVTDIQNAFVRYVNGEEKESG